MKLLHHNYIDMYSWVVKIRNTSEAVFRPQYDTDCGPMGLGQYDSLMEYCGPHTASFVFLILILVEETTMIHSF